MLPFALAAAASLALLLVAAKAHGRQVRLEREREGHHEVVFGGENAPFVVALWRRDRIRFWSVAIVAALAAGGLCAWLRPGLGWTLLAVLLWAPVAGFAAAGLASLRRLLGDAVPLPPRNAEPRKDGEQGPRFAADRGEKRGHAGGAESRLQGGMEEEEEAQAAWRRAALRGSVGWWSAAGALALAVALLAWRA